nr:hypothetical protein Iba_chr09aCG15910 [Ipomoea batatas]
MESSGRRETTSAAKENTRAFLADFMSIPRACKLGFTFTVARGSKRRLRVSCPASVCCAFLHNQISVSIMISELFRKDVSVNLKGSSFLDGQGVERSVSEEVSLSFCKRGWGRVGVKVESSMDWLPLTEELTKRGMTCEL